MIHLVADAAFPAVFTQVFRAEDPLDETLRKGSLVDAVISLQDICVGHSVVPDYPLQALHQYAIVLVYFKSHNASYLFSSISV